MCHVVDDIIEREAETLTAKETIEFLQELINGDIMHNVIDAIIELETINTQRG